MEEKKVEDMANAISGAFLFPAEDAVRELGVRFLYSGWASRMEKE